MRAPGAPVGIGHAVRDAAGEVGVSENGGEEALVWDQDAVMEAYEVRILVGEAIDVARRLARQRPPLSAADRREAFKTLAIVSLYRPQAKRPAQLGKAANPRRVGAGDIEVLQAGERLALARHWVKFDELDVAIVREEAVDVRGGVQRMVDAAQQHEPLDPGLAGQGLFDQLERRLAGSEGAPVDRKADPARDDMGQRQGCGEILDLRLRVDVNKHVVIWVRQPRQKPLQLLGRVMSDDQESDLHGVPRVEWEAHPASSDIV